MTGIRAYLISACFGTSVCLKSRIGIPLLLFALLLVSAFSAQAEVKCSDYPGGVIDGNAGDPAPAQLTIDRDCQVLNHNPLNTNITYINNLGSFFVIFDNVNFTGNMSCDDVAGHKIWFSNSSDHNISEKCRSLFIPVETIDKKNPAGQTTATVGVPFTYTLTLPSMEISGDPSSNDLHTITITDDLTATGVDLTYVSHRAYLESSGATVPLTFSNPDNKHLTFEYPLIPKGEQIVLELTVVLDDTVRNMPGTQFTNIAKWWFGRLIDGEFFEPLPGEWGRTELMTIVAPDLVVTKTGPDILGGLNLGEWGAFTIDVENAGAGDAWSITVLDRLPDENNGGMCDMTPDVESVQINGATSRILAEGADYLLSYGGAPTCELRFNLLESAGPVRPGEHLIVDYRTKLDKDSQNGATLPNIAGATQWFNDDSSNTEPRAYTRTLTNGTVDSRDHEDAHNVAVALSGYFFEKTVVNLTSGESPATVAAPGDRLRYTLRLQTTDDGLDNFAFYDELDALNTPAAFEPGTLVIVSPLPAGATDNSNPVGGVKGTGVLDIRNLSLPADSELLIRFDVTPVSPLNDGDIAANQSHLIVDDAQFAVSDDPNVDGQADPSVAGDEDPTRVVIQAPEPPSPPLKEVLQATVAIGEEITYRITVPGAPRNAVLKNVIVTDALDPSLEFVDATATLNDGGLALSTEITGGTLSWSIDAIPVGQQAEILFTARIANNDTTMAGAIVSNVASYTYVENGESRSGGSSDPADLTIVEPVVTVAKAVNPVTPPSAGDILTYTLTLEAHDGADFSGAFDLSIEDTLGPGLEYAGGAQIDGVLAEPGVKIDEAARIQTLAWPAFDLAEGDIVTITYDVRVLDNITAGQEMTNSATIRWTSLPGDQSPHERTGDLDFAYNDYVATDSTTLTIEDNTRLNKTRLNDTYGGADEDTRIGDIIDFELRLGLDEGAYSGLVLTDTLPRGMVFEGIVRIHDDTDEPFGAAAPFSHADLSGPTVSGDQATGPTVITWNLGEVVNAGDNDDTNDDFVIVYRVRILNEALAQQDHMGLINNARLEYLTATGVATRAATDGISVLQPNLSVSKTVTPAGGDTVIEAGEVITYTIEIANHGTAPSYDTVLEDVLPAGLDAGALNTMSIELVNAGAVLPVFAPAYNSATRTATWDFDSGAADAYTIPAGETLRLTCRISVDAELGAGLTLMNAATATLYHSFDDEAAPMFESIRGVREIYGPSNTAVATLTTPAPGELTKATTKDTAAIGEQFTYRITVPAIPDDTALYDVRILDDLTVSAADLRFVRVKKVAGSGTWSPENTGADTDLVIEDTSTGIDIPAGEQAIIELTVELLNTATNLPGLLFHNTADYTYNSLNDNAASRATGLPGVSGDMVIVGPDSLTLAKTGPAEMRSEVPGAFRLDVHNTGTGTAWDLTITDRLPNPDQGGMCGTPPENVTARIFAADGVTPVSEALVEGVDFEVNFTGEPDCTFMVTMLSADAAIPADHRLIVTYEATLDADNPPGAALTNVAAATEWFSGKTVGSGATGAIRTYAGVLTDGTVGVLDEQDAYTVTTEMPILSFEKTVVNVTTGQNPGTDARPGDTLRYTLRVTNVSSMKAPEFSIVDELDALNGQAIFAPGTLNLVSTPAGADITASDAAGGIHGTGLLDVRNLSLDAAGGGNDSIVIEFEAILAPVITSGTVVLNQAELFSFGAPIGNSDDPNVNGADDPDLSGDEDPTQTLITSAPVFEVWKTSTILTGDSSGLMAGESLRYTLMVKNVGNEDAVDVLLRDDIPANTTYVPNSTMLNGGPVADPSAGISPLQAGMSINAPEEATPGYLRADSGADATNVATVTFEVVVDPTAMDGLIIENQGFAKGRGIGSGPQPEQPSDDPSTPILLDPTRNVVGNLPLLAAHKTVLIHEDFGSPGIVDPGDVLRYTIRISNIGAIPATGVLLTDLVPANTTYVADSLRLNGAAVGADGGVSPLVAGLEVHSPDGAGAGIVSADGSAVITFEARVDDGVPTGSIIRNQGSVTSTELPPEPTDADGLPSNGHQPTIIIVGDVQLLSVTKEVLVVGGGIAEAGGMLEYVIRVTNIGSLPATDVVITDDLGPPLGDQVTYVAESGTLNGVTAGVSFAGSMLTADYGAVHGDLSPGENAVVRFRVRIDSALEIGSTITNTGMVRWSDPSQSDSASVSLDLGGSPGSAILNGSVWHDANLDRLFDNGELRLEGWSVELYRNNQNVARTLTDTGGAYRLSGLVPNEGSPEPYEMRFRAPAAGPNTAALGEADSPFTNGPQRISGITVASGGNLQDLNLPISPNGAVYNSVQRIPVAGARLTLVNAANESPLPGQCFDDPAQQNQVTARDGFYKFALNFSDPSCPPGAAYLVEVRSPATGYLAAPSRIIPPSGSGSADPFNVSASLGGTGDAIPATTETCEVTFSASVPALAVAPRTDGTTYYLHLLLSNGLIPGESQVFNNHIPIDPEMDEAVAITKTSPRINVSKGQLVPYTITVNNVFGAPLYDIGIVDRFPAGFKYVEGSARLDGESREPAIRGGELLWEGLELQVNDSRTLQLLLAVGAGVSEGEYVNCAQVLNTASGGEVSGEAAATVRVVPDPTFDCTDVIGKVFDDRNLDGWQDPGEKGLSGVRVVTARGLIAATDEYGRFHITCAMVPDEDRGSNFILKLDDRSLPTGYRMTTENPRVQRATRGKMLRFNFGATIQKVVGLDIADGVFEPESTEMRPQWVPRLARLIQELENSPAVLRLSYLADVEREGLVRERLKALKKVIVSEWERLEGGHRLDIETEVFWRRGGPPKR